MGAYCTDQEGWGPTSGSRVDITLCFGNTILLSLPSLLAIVVFFCRGYHLVHKHPQDQGHRQLQLLTRPLYWTSLLFMLTACIALIARIVQLTRDKDNSSPSDLLATSTLLVAWTSAIGLNYFENRVDIRSSSFIFAFYVVCIAASAIVIHTMHDLTLAGQSHFASFCVFFGAIVCGFVVEAWPRTSPLAPPSLSSQSDKKGFADNNRDNSTAYDRSNLFSRLSFHYIQPVMSLGFRRPLGNEDIANMMPRQTRTANAYQNLSRAWNHHLQKRKSSKREPSLIWVVLKAGGWAWVPIIAYSILESALDFIQPILLDNILDVIASNSTDEPKPTSLGVILAVGMFLAAVLATFSNCQYFQLGTNLGNEIKTGLISMIYQKALRLSPEARREATIGEITNHMSVDAERTCETLQYLVLLLSIVLEIIVGTWLLCRQLGPSALTGFGVVLLSVPLQTAIAKVLNKAKDMKLEFMDKRIRLLSDVLSGIRAVKLYSWERSFQEQLDEIRQNELKQLRSVGAMTAIMMIMYTSMPSLMSLLSFVVYSMVGGPNGTRATITPQVVFVSVTLFNRLAKPIGRASFMISKTIALKVALNRIQTFLLQEELDDGQVSHERTSTSNSVAIQVQDATFAWNSLDHDTNTTTEVEAKDQRPALNKVNLLVPRGSLTVLMGRVGHGKSSLLSAIIGDMYKRQGTVKVYGSVAYVPQQAWIINATVRDNILFGKAFDQERYDRILYASGLLPDLEILSAGDLTEIGERGINLSGGQKQRVSLARAAYQDADVYLMDDPLSAVDAHVDQHLWEHLVGPNGLLKDKSRLLITHGIHHLSEADQIMVLRDGTIDESGSYTELMALRGSFSQLIEEYSVKENVSQDASGSGANTVDAKTDQGISSEKAVAAITSQEDDTAEESDADLISKEVIAEGSIGWNVFKSYARAATWFFAILSILGFIFSQATQIGVNLWLEKWAGAPDQYPLGVFLGVYGALVACYIVLDLGVNMTIFILGGIRASTVIHNRLLDRMLRLPMSFFDTTPVGRIVNRFSSDMDNIDELIPFNISDTYFFLMTVLGVLIVIASSVPIFLAVIPVIAIAFGLTQLWYIRASRSLKRIHSISKSPLYQHFSETLAGVSTIRAMQITDRFILDNAAKSDDSANAFFVYEVAQRWLHFRLENMAAVITFITALLAVHTLGPSMAGLVISYALNLTFPMTQLVTAYSELQNQLISVERVEEYSTKNEEAPATLPSDGDLPPDWPNQGRIVIQHYSTRYREGMDLVLKDISLEIQPKERVGVVGRTGAGKSSLTLALFRIVEAANSHWAKASHNGPDSTSTLTSSPVGTGETKDAEESDKSVDLKEIKAEDKVGGAILIDGVDISTVGLERLRKHLAIIPQDPILFAGTLRDNLDPFTEATDAELWEALERAHLKTHISTLEGGLSAEVAQNGENFSVGQRSLICLARALLRKTKILILDEATAAVDVETDDLIQQTIRKEFKDRTILTIAHRIKTIMDSDKILVLERGRVQEFGTPSDLLQSQGLFYSLAKQAGQA